MKKYLVKRYLDSVDPREVSESDREYASTPEILVEMYGMEDMCKLAEMVYHDDDSSDIFRIKKDDNGYYVVTYTLVQNEEVEEEEEVFEMFKFKVIKLDENIYVSSYDPDMDDTYEENLLVIEERK